MFFTASGVERDELKLQFVQAQNRMLQRLSNIVRGGRADLTTKLSTWDPFSHKPALWFDPEWMFGIKEGFDIVIANPPYVSYGLRGVQKMNSNEKESIKLLYPNPAEYKISLYALFMDLSIQLSKDPGGIQTYIVPDSFLLGRYFSKIRTLILNNDEISHISWFPYKIFDAAVGFSVVYTFIKDMSYKKDNLIDIRKVQNNDQLLTKDYKAFHYHQSYFEQTKYHRFRLFFDKQAMNLVSKIESKSRELGEFYTGRTGVRALIGQKNIVSKEQKTEKWQKGIISGSSVIKYKILYENDYITEDGVGY